MESTYFPAIWITDPRVRWEAIDNETALLIVPFDEEKQQSVVRFDTQIVELLLINAIGTATWLDQGTPWTIFTAEKIVYNVDMREAIRDRGIRIQE